MALVLGLVGAVVVGCTQWSSLVPDRVSPNEDTQIASESVEQLLPELSAPHGENGVTSCGLTKLFGAEREAAIQEALSNPKVQNLEQELNSRGFRLNANDSLTYNLDDSTLVYLPAGPGAGIIYESRLGNGFAIAAIQDENRTINIRPDRGVRFIAGFDPKTRDKFFKQIRKNRQVKSLEKNLQAQDQRIDWNQSILFVDTDGGSATIGLAIRETNSNRAAWFGYRVSAKVKGNKLSVQNITADRCAGAASEAANRMIKPAMQENYQIAPELFVNDGGGGGSTTVTYTGGGACVTGTRTACFVDIINPPVCEVAISSADQVLNTPTNGAYISVAEGCQQTPQNGQEGVIDSTTVGGVTFARDKIRGNIAMVAGFDDQFLSLGQISTFLDVAAGYRTNLNLNNALPPWIGTTNFIPVCGQVISGPCLLIDGPFASDNSVNKTRIDSVYTATLGSGNILEQLIKQILHPYIGGRYENCSPDCITRVNQIKNALSTAINKARQIGGMGGVPEYKIKWYVTNILSTLNHPDNPASGNSAWLNGVMTDLGHVLALL